MDDSMMHDEVQLRLSLTSILKQSFDQKNEEIRELKSEVERLKGVLRARSIDDWVPFKMTAN